jgi:flagellar biosynthesis regulator FlbT
MLNPWIALAFKAAQMTAEAQSVIALRMLRLAAGGSRMEAETTRMVTEKIAAAAEANVAAAVAALGGRSHHVIANKALKVIRKRVRANKRRLSRR